MNHDVRKNSSKRLLIGIMRAFVFVIILHIIANTNPIISHYTVQNEKINDSFRIALLSDLHGTEFGEDNVKIINLIKDEKPDIICISGDLVNKKRDSSKAVISLMEQLLDIAPVYYSFGNHEAESDSEQILNLISELKCMGVNILDECYITTSINGNDIRIGGFYGYGAPDDSEETTNSNTFFLREFQQTNNLKIMLSHMPLCWYKSDSLNYWDIDLVLCGHTHGGQIRIPFVGGLYAPDVGLFPGKEKGIYQSEDTTKQMVLTTGLGNTDFIPRMNNRPEIVIIDYTN